VFWSLDFTLEQWSFSSKHRRKWYSNWVKRKKRP